MSSENSVKGWKYCGEKRSAVREPHQPRRGFIQSALKGLDEFALAFLFSAASAMQTSPC